MRPTPNQLLKQAKKPRLLITDLLNIQYLSGLKLTFGAILVTPKRYTLFVDPRYIEKALSGAAEGVVVRPFIDLKKVVARVPECGIEAHDVTLERFHRLKKAHGKTKFLQTGDSVQEFRRTKDEQEIKYIKKAESITRELFRRTPSALKRLPTEQEFSWQLQTWAHELGADGMSFPPIVAFGSHTSRPHHSPTKRRLRKGHIVQLDCGVKVHGYCSDMSRVFWTDTPKPIEEEVYNVVATALKEVKKSATAGTKASDLDQLARTIIGDSNFEPFPHALGHGVGLDVHEGAVMRPASKDVLQEGEVLALEPAIYLPGKFGIRLEDMVIVK